MNLIQLKRLDRVLGEILIYLFSPAAFLINQYIKSYIRPKNSICVLKILGGGSLLIAYPALLAIRNQYPNKKLFLISTREVKVYADLLGIFDEIYIIDMRSMFNLLLSTFRVLRYVSRSQFFLNLEMHSKLCAFYTLASFSKERFGLFQSWNKWQKNYINNPIFYNSHTPIYVGYEQLAESIGCSQVCWELVMRSFQQVNNFSSCGNATSNFSRVVLAPFCSSLYKEREFSPDEWVKILPHYLPAECKEIIIIGGRADMDKSNQFELILVKNFPQYLIVNKTGKTSLTEVLDEFKIISKLITIDSGINHLARLLGLPIVSFWGPSDPVLRLKNINPLIERHHYHKITCSPCVHLIDIPPCNGNNICMKIHYKNNKNISPIWKIR